MKKFLEDFLDWLKIMGLTIVLSPIWFLILTYGFNVDLANLSKKFSGLLLFLPPFIISGILIELFDKEEVEVEQEENNTPKVEEPKVDEIISVTEIKGTRKIIKNGKVIFSEELKADELKYFEKFKE